MAVQGSYFKSYGTYRVASGSGSGAVSLPEAARVLRVWAKDDGTGTATITLGDSDPVAIEADGERTLLPGGLGGATPVSVANTAAYLVEYVV